MSKHLFIRSMAAMALGGMVIAMHPRIASADPVDSSNSSTGQSAAGNNGSNYQPVYDVSSAAAKEAAAETQYSQTYADLVGVGDRLRSEFYASGEYRAAVKAVDEARAAYDAASAPVLAKVHADPQFAYLSNNKDWMGRALTVSEISREGTVDLATRKMDFASRASRMEASALQEDADVRQAQSKLNDAHAALNARTAQFQASLYTNPALVQAKQAFDLASTNLAAAKAFLDGAMLARADTIAADERRYSGQIVTNWGPYNSGYYGIGNGYYGTSIGFTPFGK